MKCTKVVSVLCEYGVMRVLRGPGVLCMLRMPVCCVGIVVHCLCVHDVWLCCVLCVWWHTMVRGDPCVNNNGQTRALRRCATKVAFALGV